MSLASDPLLSVTSLAKAHEPYLILEAGAGKVDGEACEVALQRHLYAQGHIPGAVFADLAGDFSDPACPWPYQRPGAERFTQAARETGVDTARSLLIYDRGEGIWAARLWWLFRAYGHDAVQVLDGGLKAWSAAGLPLEQGTAATPLGNFTASPERAGYFVDRKDVQAIVEGQRTGQLLNVLRRPVFTGEELRYQRRGHIPGSQHVPYGTLLEPESARLLPAETLRSRFIDLNVRSPIIVYCGSGITAAGGALALSVAGRNEVAVYDGSLAEWTADPALPLVTVPS